MVSDVFSHSAKVLSVLEVWEHTVCQYEEKRMAQTNLVTIFFAIFFYTNACRFQNISFGLNEGLVSLLRPCPLVKFMSKTDGLIVLCLDLFSPH